MAGKLKKENNVELSDNIDAVNAKETKKALKEQKKKEKKEKKKGKKKIIFLLPVLLLIGGLVAVIVFNVGNIRENYLRPTMEKIPVVKNLLPEKPSQDEYSNLSREQLIEQTKVLTAENQKLSDDSKVLTNRINDLNKEMLRLQEIENAQVQFRQEKADFDKMIASNDPDAYKSYYEKISPENADNLYREIVTDSQDDAKLKDYIATFENMKKDSAASVLEQMINTDMDLVVLILSNIDSEQRGNILSAMQPANAAAVTKRLAPTT